MLSLIGSYKKRISDFIRQNYSLPKIPQAMRLQFHYCTDKPKDHINPERCAGYFYVSHRPTRASWKRKDLFWFLGSMHWGKEHRVEGADGGGQEAPAEGTGVSFQGTPTMTTQPSRTKVPRTSQNSATGIQQKSLWGITQKMMWEQKEKDKDYTMGSLKIFRPQTWPRYTKGCNMVALNFCFTKINLHCS